MKIRTGFLLAAILAVMMNVRLAAQVHVGGGGNATALQGIPVATTTPTNGQCLAYSLGIGKWQPAACSPGGTVTSVATGTGLTGGPITTSGTISLIVPVLTTSGGTGVTDFSFSGSTHKAATVSGSTISGNCGQWDVSGNIVDSGVACGGSGTVTSFSAGTLSPLFTTSVATATTTPALSFALTNAAGSSWFGNASGSTGAPSYNTTAFPVAMGGTGTASTLTGLIRGSASAFTAAEISGDCTTSGSNAITCTKTNNVSFAPSATTDTTTVSNVANAFDIRVANSLTQVAAPSSPSAGFNRAWMDSTDARLHDINPAGVKGTTVVADAGAANNFLTAISAAGVISKAQPSCANLSDSTLCAASTPLAVASGGTGATSFAAAGLPLTATVTIDASHLQVLHGTPVQGIAQPGSSSALSPFGGFFEYIPGSRAFLNAAAGSTCQLDLATDAVNPPTTAYFYNFGSVALDASTVKKVPLQINESTNVTDWTNKAFYIGNTDNFVCTAGPLALDGSGVAVNTAGTNYVDGDSFTLSGCSVGSNDATGTITTDGSGHVASVVFTSGGVWYSPGTTGCTTTTTSLAGAGLTLNIVTALGGNGSVKIAIFYYVVSL
jgi:hypothetical protein